MSTIAERHPSAPGTANKRAFLAGGTAAAALIAAAALVLVSLAAYVAFEGIPGGGGDTGTGSVAIESGASLDGAPEDAARVLAQASAEVAPTPAASTPIAPAPRGMDDGPGGAGGPFDSALAGPRVIRDPGTEPTAPGLVPTSAPGSQQGTVGRGVAAVEGGTDPVVDTPLADATGEVTAPLDQGIDQALDGVGGALGNPRLGGQMRGAGGQGH